MKSTLTHAHTSALYSTAMKACFMFFLFVSPLKAAGRQHCRPAAPQQPLQPAVNLKAAVET